MKKLIYIYSAVLMLAGCTQKPDAVEFNPDSLNDSWRGTLALNDSTTLPFIFNIANGQGNTHTILFNGVEKIMLAT